MASSMTPFLYALFSAWAAIPWGSRGPDSALSFTVGVHMHVDPTFCIQARVFHVHLGTKFNLIYHNFHQGICRLGSSKRYLMKIHTHNVYFHEFSS
jgi:hypothetical protein